MVKNACLFIKCTYITGISVLFLSCSDNLIHKEFEEYKQLQTTAAQLPVADPAAYMRYPFRIRLADSVLYIMDYHAPTAHCHQFSYPGLEYKRSLAYKGDAPDCFLTAYNIRLDTKGNFYFLDAAKKRITQIETESGDIRNETPLSAELLRTLDFACLSDSLYAVPDYTGTHRVTIITNTGEIRDKLFSIPQLDNKKTKGVPLAQAWRAFIDYNPDNGILAMVTQLGEVLEIYDLKNNSTINVVVGYNGAPEYLDKGSYIAPNGIMGYSDVQVTSDRIYALFWGTSMKEIQQEDKIRDGGNLIQEFDLTGNPLCLYELDRHIAGFCIHEENRKLIALDLNSDEPIIIYDL